MIRNRLIALIIGAFALPMIAYPISRIGGGRVGSLSSGFTAALPGVYQQMETGNDHVQLFVLPWGPMDRTGAKQTSLLLAEVSDHFPKMEDLNRKNSAIYLKYIGLKEVSARFGLDGCIDVFQRSTHDTDQFVLVWGSGRGFQLSYTKDAQARFDAYNLVRSVRLLDGACTWE